MSRIYFKPLPDESTPATAERINGLLNGEESIEKIVAGSIEGKNLFDKNTITITQGSFSYINGNETTDNTRIRSSFFKIEPNTTYTISINSVIGEIGIVYKQSDNSTIIQGIGETTNNNYYTFTTPSNAYYMRFRLGNSSNTKTAGTEYNIQLEKDNQATDYVPYMKYGYNSEESMGNIVVDDISCKNVFNMLDTSKFTYRYKGSSPYYQSFIKPTYSSNEIKVYGGGGSYTEAYIDVTGLKPNAQYTISYAIKENTLGFNPLMRIGNNGITDDNGAITLTLALQNGSTSASTSNYVIYSNIQLELGSETTSYTPYKSFDSTAYVLWTNPDDAQSFANQLVSLNDARANYKYYEIIYKRNTTDARYCSTGRIPTNKAFEIYMTRQFNYVRTITELWDNSVRFSDCVYFGTYGSMTTTTSNNYIIPYQILGYK